MLFRYRFHSMTPQSNPSNSPEPFQPSTKPTESTTKPAESATKPTELSTGPSISMQELLEGALNREWYWKNRDKIRKNYEGQKIAIECRRIIAHAGAEFELYDELRKSMSSPLFFVLLYLIKFVGGLPNSNVITLIRVGEEGILPVVLTPGIITPGDIALPSANELRPVASFDPTAQFYGDHNRLYLYLFNTTTIKSYIQFVYKLPVSIQMTSKLCSLFVYNL
jgi:hypothetical protein